MSSELLAACKVTTIQDPEWKGGMIAGGVPYWLRVEHVESEIAVEIKTYFTGRSQHKALQLALTMIEWGLENEQ